MHLLFLTHRLPYAPNRGDRLRAWHELRRLSARHVVTLVSLTHDREEASHAADLDGVVHRAVIAPAPWLANRLRGTLSLPGNRPLTHALLDSPAMGPALDRLVAEERPDAIFAYCSGMARFACQPPLDRLPLLLDMVDADSAKWAALARTARWPLRAIYSREARCLARFERVAMHRALVTLVVNEREREALRALEPDARIVVVPNGVDVDAFAPRPTRDTAAPAVVFCGVMDYPPNEAGARWLAREVWPLVRRARPDASLWLVGARPTSSVQALASRRDDITVTGAVDDVRPWLWRAAIAAAPLHTARGVQNKVLEAVAAGLPVLVTAAVWDGLPDAVRPACIRADAPGEWAERIVKLLHLPPDDRQQVARAADVSALSWAAQLTPLDGLIEEAGRST